MKKMMLRRFIVIWLVACAVTTGCSQSTRDRAESPPDEGRMAEQSEMRIDEQATCARNLKLLVSAKGSYMLEFGGNIGDTVTPEQVALYLDIGALRCPSGGEYSLGTIFETDGNPKKETGGREHAPECSIHGSAADLLSGTEDSSSSNDAEP
jgi:hypothetical protein